MLAHISRKLLTDSLRSKSSQQYLRTALFRPHFFKRGISQQTPVNTIFMFVPEQEVWIVERMGKYHRHLKPGLNVLIPIIDKIKYVQCLKEIPIEVNQKTAITSDNVTLSIDSVLFLKIKDAYLASYGVEDPEYAISQLVQTTIRSELSKMSLDDVLHKNETISDKVISSVNKTTEAWGMNCLRFEIRNIDLPPSIEEAMKVQAEAERKSKAAALEAESVKTADINVAEGRRSAKIIESEAEREELINKANGEAAALCIIAEARAKSIGIIANVLKNQNNSNEAAVAIALQYVSVFEKMAKSSNTLVIPTDICDISQVITKALSINRNGSENSQPSITEDSNKVKTIA